jgi:preprotein translocase YajC subunit
MTNLFAAVNAKDIPVYIVFGLIIVGFTVMIIMQSKKRKVQQTEYNSMIDSLRVGVRVKTVGGVIGVIKEIREEAPNFKTVLLETPSLIRYDVQAIYGIVDEAALNQANQKPQSIEQHKEPDAGIDKPQDAFKAKKTSPKSGTTNKN